MEMSIMKSFDFLCVAECRHVIWATFFLLCNSFGRSHVLCRIVFSLSFSNVESNSLPEVLVSIWGAPPLSSIRSRRGRGAEVSSVSGSKARSCTTQQGFLNRRASSKHIRPSYSTYWLQNTRDDRSSKCSLSSRLLFWIGLGLRLRKIVWGSGI
jgi:hypothetical protein